MMPMPWIFMFILVFTVFFMVEAYFNFVMSFLPTSYFKTFSLNIVSLPW
uniref:ATP synthase subunit 8 n=1 Tax=Histiostomatidae sp. XFX TaxID=2652661 RepID=A0A5J6VF78_9ACAR|nr:ATP synthase subunit 8 [Histiostomatidae sp. XFX]